MRYRWIAILLVLMLALSACNTTPLTSPLPAPTPTEMMFYTQSDTIPAYPGPGPQRPSQGLAPDTDNVPIALVHKYFFPIMFGNRPPSKLGWEAASDGQALAARTAILALSPGTVRTGIAWKDVEPIRGGGYIWSASKDAHVNLLAEGGNRIIGILNFPPQWAQVLPGCSPVAPTYYYAWLDYVKATVERYGDRITVWEIINEADAGISPDIRGFGCWGDASVADQGGTVYGKFASMTAKGIRKIQPDAIIISSGLAMGCDVAGQWGSCTGASLDFIRAALPWMEDDINGVGIHAYEYWKLVPPTETEMLNRKVAALRNITDLPIWLTEGGFLCWRGTDPFLCNSLAYEQAQAEYVRLWAESCRRSGLESCVAYSLTRNTWAHADLIGPNQVPRLGYYVLQTELMK